MAYKKASMYTMFFYVSRFAFLLIIPVLKQLLLKFNSVSKNFHFVLLEILILVAIMIFSFLEYNSVAYCLNKNSIIIKKGIFFKRITEIPYDKIYYVRVKRSAFSILFFSCKITFGTHKKFAQNANIFLNNKNLDCILNSIFKIKKKNFSYKISNTKILFMSVMWSNIFASLIIGVPFINKIGAIIGKELSNEIYSSIDKSSFLIKVGLPPLISTLIFLLFIFFLITIISEFVKYFNFSVKNFSDHILIKRGIIFSEEKIIKKKYINAVAIKQTAWMKLFKIYSAYVYTVGYLSDKTDKSLLIVAQNKEKLFPLLNALYLKNSSTIKSTKTKSHSLIGFLAYPLLFMALLLSSLRLFSSEIWYEKIASLIIFFFIPLCMWWAIIKIMAYKNTSLSKNSAYLVLGGYDKLSLYLSYIPICKIQNIVISQNFFQKFFGTCNVNVYISSEKKYKFYCKQLNHDVVKNFVKNVQN